MQSEELHKIGDGSEEIQRKTCAACAEEILAAATKCKHCGSLQPGPKAGAAAGAAAGGCLGLGAASFMAIGSILIGALLSVLGLPIIGIPFAVGGLIAAALAPFFGGALGAAMEAKEPAGQPDKADKVLIDPLSPKVQLVSLIIIGISAIWAGWAMTH
jgi:hypothetical protein